MTEALRKSFDSLTVPNYRRYFTGQVVSLSGNWMQTVAEIWLILSLTGSGLAVGFTAALQFLPIMLVGAWGGALADRFAKRRLLMVTQTLMMIPPIILFAFTVTGLATPALVFALVFCRGLVNAADNPARQAFVMEMVGPDRVVNAVSLNSVLINSARVIGPGLAGILIALVGVAACFGLNALTFVVMLVALRGMDPRALLDAPTPDRDRAGVLDAIRHVRETPEIAVPLMLMALVGTLGFNFQVVLPLLAKVSFHGGPGAFALLLSAMGAGSIIGALFTGARGKTGLGLIGVSAGAFGGLALLAAVMPDLAATVPVLALLGAASVSFAAAVNSTLQLAASPEMRGRVMALYTVVFLGSTPIGGPLVGWISQSAGPRLALVLAGAAGLAAAAAVAVIRHRRARTVPQPA